MSTKKKVRKQKTARKKTSNRQSSTRNPLRPPSATLRLHDLLWQMETWLREMVYIELRCRDAVWESAIRRRVQGWPPRSQSNDKAYWHMSTRHQSAISYLTTGEIFDIIFNESNWNLFEKYFPKKDLFSAKIEEIKQIRHRVAHFRAPHEKDVDRVRLLLQDIDSGVWNFCTSYGGIGNFLPKEISDPATEYFASTHEKRVVVEMNGISREGGTHEGDEYWLYARNSLNPSLGFYLRYSVRPWAELGPPSLMGKPGVVYHANFRSLGMDADRALAHERILQETQSVHRNCLHIMLQDPRSLEVTVPSVINDREVC